MNFYLKIVEGILWHLFVQNEFYMKLNVFDKETALLSPNRDTTVRDVLFVARELGGFSEKQLRDEWCELFRDVRREDVENFDIEDFDEMWVSIASKKNDFGQPKYATLTNLVSLVRTLPHSNAEAERVFSDLTNVISRNRNKMGSIRECSNYHSICAQGKPRKKHKQAHDPRTCAVNWFRNLI